MVELSEKDRITLLMLRGWGDQQRGYKTVMRLFNENFRNENNRISKSTVNRTIQRFEDWIYSENPKRKRSWVGVALLICDSLSFQVHSISHPVGFHVDTVGIILHINHKKIAVVCVYRPPRSPLSDLGHIEACLSEVACCSDFIVCMGDFNIIMLSQTDIGTKQMRSLMSLFSLRQVVDSPTHITCSSESLIDLILVSSGVNIVESCTCDAFSISDHCAVCAVLCLRRPLRRSRVFFISQFEIYFAR
ncbi:hypothetical protein ALC57_15708 [Trachymyrmex cornetzi]|uniref:Endonuclease/exonuclease/phosphatase domain-containing protein n=1 Tax=Trachymyrmex cornetzi TaxID=471704 RepID=A0A151IWD2_9HYME|nr:hypothetical protein ALC57_15708 [Trachymyrmex cornetzi]